jgi:excinuclease UvrABC nuclease subunit
MFDIDEKPQQKKRNSFSSSFNNNNNNTNGAALLQRVCRESGVVQYDHFFEHTGSPIRIKILLPNQSFYLNDSLNHTSMNVNNCPNNGSILKQHKIESKANANNNNSNNTPSNTNNNDANNTNGEVKFDDAETRRNEENVNANMQSANKPKPARAELDDLFDFETANQQVECYENLRPVWHDGMNAYVLHFDNHRVREKSVKNFKLVRSNDNDKRTVLQFGRVVDRNVFVMDFAYPLTALQAFQICLSSIDPKLAV